MQQDIHFSIVIPVYNRPGEVEELLASLSGQTDKDFEVVIVEDGSSVKCDSVVDFYHDKLNIKYFYKDNSGPGLSRNYGYENAEGNYCIFLDSDCVLPSHYIQIVRRALACNYTDAFGGPDKAHDGFTKLQKAINYSMTSFFTTGGIRGGSEKMDKFYPRSFNMGYSREVYDATKGFSSMRFGEDIDMSIRILKCGFKTRLIKEAFVYHKRRTNLRRFYRQVFNSGTARISLCQKHPGSLKPVHLAPSLFTAGCAFLLLASVVWTACLLLPLALYALLLFCDSTFRNRSAGIGLLSVVTGFVQLGGYGAGFISALLKKFVAKKDEYYAFEKNFYR